MSAPTAYARYLRNFFPLVTFMVLVAAHSSASALVMFATSSGDTPGAEIRIGAAGVDTPIGNLDFSTTPQTIGLTLNQTDSLSNNIDVTYEVDFDLTFSQQSFLYEFNATGTGNPLGGESAMSFESVVVFKVDTDTPYSFSGDLRGSSSGGAVGSTSFAELVAVQVEFLFRTDQQALADDNSYVYDIDGLPGGDSVNNVTLGGTAGDLSGTLVANQVYALKVNHSGSGAQTNGRTHTATVEFLFGEPPVEAPAPATLALASFIFVVGAARRKRR